jgi:membrane fusion protein, multidrug efflux system
MNATAQSLHHDAPVPTAAKDAASPRAHKTHAPSRRGTRFRPIIVTVVVLALLAWGVRFAINAYHYVETDDAFVAGHLHTVSAQVDGQVKEVLVADNQRVRAGDVLVRLDPLQFQIALDKATAALAQATAQEQQLIAAARQADAAVAEAVARVTQAEAQRTQTIAQRDLAKVTLSRSEQLFRANGSAQAELDQARTAADAAAAAHDAAEANLLAARAAVKSAEAAQASAHAQTQGAHAAIAAAEAAQRDAQRQLSYTSITAPADGWIGNKHVEPGNRIQAGQALFALAQTDAWVVANFKETQLAHMRVGQPVELTIDAIPDAKLHGKVDSVSPASGAQFALLPPDNSTGNFNKVVQRVPVKITLDPESLSLVGDRIRLGLSAIVNVRVR